MKKLLVLVGAAVLMAACSESSTGPAAAVKAPARPSADDITCRSGYIIAYDENGNAYCAPADGGMESPATASPAATFPTTSVPTTKPKA